MGQTNTTLSEDDKDILQRRYSDLIFVDAVIDEIKCSKCNRVAISHFTTTCGHLYCSSCIEILETGIQFRNKWNCSYCSESISEQMLEQSSCIEKNIMKLRSYCPNYENGCRSILTLRDIPFHLIFCNLSSVTDSLQYKTTSVSSINGKDSSSMSILQNDFIELESKMMKKEQSFERLSQQFGHNVELMKQQIEELRQAQSKLESEFRILNRKCDVANARLNEIPTTIKHLKDEIQNLLSTKEENVQTKIDGQLQSASESSPTSEQDNQVSSTSYIWQIDNVHHTFQNRIEQTSPTFTVNQQVVSAQAKIKFQHQNVAVTIYFLNPGRKAGVLQMDPPYPTVTFFLLDLSEAKVKLDISRTLNVGFGEILQSGEEFESTTILTQNQILPRYLKNNSIVLKIVIEYTHLIEKPQSTNGILMWKVENVQKLKMKQFFADFHSSPYFYTSENGYRANATISLQNEVTIFVQFLSGEFDRFLPQTQSFTVTAVLIDQSCNKSNTCIKKTQSGFNYIEIVFLDKNNIKKISNYLNNDCLYIRIELVAMTNNY